MVLGSINEIAGRIPKGWEAGNDWVTLLEDS